MNFPDYRGRRVRRTEGLRRMVRETRLSVDNLCYPLFCAPGQGVQKPIASMPGQHVWSVDKAVDAAAAAYDAGIPSVILFGIPEKKDAVGSEAWSANGVVQRAIKRDQEALPRAGGRRRRLLLRVHRSRPLRRDPRARARQRRVARESGAHRGLVREAPASTSSRPRACSTASSVRAGSRSTRRASTRSAIMAYSAKYASAYYGPFRDAVDSAPQHGDRRGYQMDPANAAEAVREVTMDVGEGADIVMVKPALAYLDVIRASPTR
jgi:porphobilinogen synthase